jgi:mannosyltransferase
VQLPDRSRASSRQLLCLVGIIVVAAALRLSRLSSESFWLDEIQQAKIASLIPRLGWRAVAINDYVAPLSHYVTWAMQAAFGDSEVVARIPSALAGIALVPAAYAFAARLFTPRIGLITAALVALSPYSAWYSRDARMYSLLMLASTLYLLCFVEAVTRPNRLNAALLVLLGVIGIYIHQYFVLVLFSSTAYIAVTRLRSNRKLILRLILLNALSVLSYLPWAVAMSHYNPGTVGTSRSGRIFFAPYTVLSFIIGFDFGPSVREMQTIGAGAAMRAHALAIAVPIAVLVAIGIALILKLRAHIREKEPSEAIYFVITLAVLLIGIPVVVGLISSKFNFNVRYCAPALVPVMILIAVALDGIRIRSLALFIAVSLGAVLVLSTYHVLSPGDRYAREDLRSTSHFLSANPPRGPLIVESDKVVGGLRWYGFGGPVVAVRSATDPAVEAAINDARSPGGKVTLVQSREWETDPAGEVPKRLTASGFKLDKVRSFAGSRISEFTFEPS